MIKIHKNIDKTKKKFGYEDNQIPHIKFNLPDGWDLSRTFECEISHGDIIEYTDGSQEIFDEGDLPCDFFLIFYTEQKTGIKWRIDLEWRPNYNKRGDYTSTGEYAFLLTKDDPEVEDSSRLPWIRVLSQSKHVLIALINRIMPLISESNMEELLEIRKKYHHPYPDIDDEEYWKNPSKWWNSPSLDYLISSTINCINLDSYETLFHQLGDFSIKDIKSSMLAIPLYLSEEIKMRDLELAERVERFYSDVLSYIANLESLGVKEEDVLSRKQYEDFLFIVKPMYDELKERYDLEKKQQKALKNI